MKRRIKPSPKAAMVAFGVTTLAALAMLLPDVAQMPLLVVGLVIFCVAFNHFLRRS